MCVLARTGSEPSDFLFPGSNKEEEGGCVGGVWAVEVNTSYSAQK